MIKSAVSIKADDRIIGSGFIDKNLNVITAYHVVAGENDLHILVLNHTIPANMEMSNPYTDIAILDLKVYRSNVSDLGITGLEIAYSNSIHIPQKVMVIGSPSGLEKTVTTGIISTIN